MHVILAAALVAVAALLAALVAESVRILKSGHEAPALGVDLAASDYRMPADAFFDSWLESRRTLREARVFAAGLGHDVADDDGRDGQAREAQGDSKLLDHARAGRGSLLAR